MFAEVLVKNFLKQASRGEVSLSPEVLEEFTSDCKAALEKQFGRRSDWRLRMSGLGRPLCQQLLDKEGIQEEISYNAILRFLIGDLVEAAVMAVMKSAGVNVVEAQTNCELELADTQVRGTLDVVIDDPVSGLKVWDIKSASPYSYSQKFGKGYDGLKEDDPFGYLVQGHLYARSRGLPFGGWIVVDKSSGEIMFVEAPDDTTEDAERYFAEAEATVKKLNENFSFKNPPFKPEPETYKLAGATHDTGNKLLNKACTFCGYRQHCWPKAILHEKVTSRARVKPLVWYHTLKVKEL